MLTIPNPQAKTTVNYTQEAYTIVADYINEDSLSILYNCVLAITGSREEFRLFSQIHSLSNEIDIQPNLTKYQNEFIEDEFNVIHMGPWQYSLHLLDEDGEGIADTEEDFNSERNVGTNKYLLPNDDVKPILHKNTSASVKDARVLMSGRTSNLYGVHGFRGDTNKKDLAERLLDELEDTDWMISSTSKSRNKS